MKWYFINSKMLTSSDSGFTIRLVMGSWKNPVEIRPDNTTISIYDQAKMLREGLELAKNKYDMIERDRSTPKKLSTA